MQQDKGRVGGSTLWANAARHHLVVIVACVLIGVTAGWYVPHASPQSYTSSSSVLINPAEGNPYAPSPRNDELVSLETEAQIVRSDVVLRRALSEGAPAATTAELEQSLQVVVPTNTQILQVSYTAADPEAAQDTVQAVTSAYLDNRRERSEDVIDGQVDRIEEQTATVIRDLRAATAASQQGDAATRAFQTQLADSLNAELVNLRAQRTTLENASPRPGQIISPATLPGAPSLFKQLAYAVAGGLAGLLAGLLLAMLLERWRGVVRSRRDVERLGISVLTAPELSRRQRRSKSAVTLAIQETIRRVRSGVLDAEPRVRTIAVGASPREGAEPGVAAKLAASLARADRAVVMVDADRPLRGQAGAGDADARPGLTDLLSGRHGDVASLLSTTEEPRFRVLGRGMESQEASDYFVADRLTAVLAPLRSAHDYVVLRTPSLVSTQGEALSRAADLTILVVIAGETRMADVARLARHEGFPGQRLAAVIVPREALPLGGRQGGRTSDDGRRRGSELVLAKRESAPSKVS